MIRFTIVLVISLAIGWPASGHAAVPQLTPRLIGEITPPFNLPVNPDWLANVSGTLFFRARSLPGPLPVLWKSDGTQDGTVVVSNVYPGAGYNLPDVRVGVDDTFFFIADGSAGVELWKSNGTEVGTHLVRDVRPGFEDSLPQSLTDYNGNLLFTANESDGTGFWMSDGTEAGTVRIRNLSIPRGSSAEPFTIINDVAYFVANEDPYGIELWRSDGTDAGTYLVTDIREGPGWSWPRQLTNVDDTLFFTANDGTGGEGIWKSDGTEAGTIRISLNFIGSGANQPHSLTGVGGMLLFVAGDAENGVELWLSDGTVAGTALVTDIFPGRSFPGIPGVNSSRPALLTNVDGTLFFTADDGVHGRELWKSDGTSEGTVMVVDLSPGSASTTFDFGIGPYSEFLAVNGLLFFTAAVPSTVGDGSDHSLFVTDGTAEGTSALLTFEDIVTFTPPISELIFYRHAPALSRRHSIRRDWSTHNVWTFRYHYTGTERTLASGNGRFMSVSFSSTTHRTSPELVVVAEKSLGVPRATKAPSTLASP